MPHVDESREEAAIQNAIKNGTTDYSKLLGPDWKTALTALSEQLEFARTLNIPLSAFETKAGGATETSAGNDETKGKNNE